MGKDTGGSAFPREDYQSDDAPGQRGMTLRDYFAGQVLASITASALFDPAVREITGSLAAKNDTDRPHLIAATCYQIADAMLNIRKLEDEQ
jgi:hypothetical protein